MKFLWSIFLCLTPFSVLICQSAAVMDNPLNENEVYATDMLVEVLPKSKKIQITYDINDKSELSYYLAKVRFIDMNGLIITPIEMALEGHIGEIAFQGGFAKSFIWDTEKQGLNGLLVGQFELVITKINREDNPKLYRLHRRVVKLDNKLELNLSRSREQRLLKRIDRKQQRIDKDNQ